MPITDPQKSHSGARTRPVDTIPPVSTAAQGLHHFRGLSVIGILIIADVSRSRYHFAAIMRGDLVERDGLTSEESECSQGREEVESREHYVWSDGILERAIMSPYDLT